MTAALERLWPDAVVGDKSYSSTDIRNWLRQRGIEPVIPKRTDELGPSDDDHQAYRERSTIECAINRLNRYRLIATRYEKLADASAAMVAMACILEWL